MHRVIIRGGVLISFLVRCYRSKWVSATALLIAVVLSTTQTGLAQTIDWANTSGTPNPWYQVDGNWTGGVAPGSTETARFDQAGSYEVWWDGDTVSTAPEVEFLEVLDGEVTFLNNGGTGQHELTILGSGGVGSFDDLSIAGSSTTLTNRGLHLRSLGGAQITDGGTVTLDGSHAEGAMLSVDGAVGFQIDGNLNVEAGSLMSNTLGYVGLSPGSTGVATVTGTGSEWNNSSDLYVGLFGNGTLNVEADGLVSNSTGYLGYLPGSTGTATVTGDGSQWINSGGLFLGGTATSDGGVGTLDLADFGKVVVGNDTDGPNISFNTEFVVSDFGSNGNLWVRNGSSILHVGAGVIGHSAGSKGVASVTGGGSYWDVNGNLRVGYSGDGTLNIEAGGVVDAWNTFIGSQAGSTGSATISGSGSLLDVYDLYVGSSGHGTLRVEAGGVVNSFGGAVGNQTGSNGVAIVTGTGSQWNNSGRLSICPTDSGGSSSSDSNGTLNIEDGGFVSSDGANIGQAAGSTGVVNVIGSGSQWDNSEGQTMQIGVFGQGTLNIESGGFVWGGNSYIGEYNGSTGVVNVKGTDSLWLPNQLRVGNQGDGVLNVESGGVVNSGRGYISYFVGAMGVATVTGGGSQWNNSGSVYVGYFGDGMLNVEAGGLVSSWDGYLGENGGSIGTVTVTGIGSQWNNSSQLFVGNRGSGTLNVEAGGVVSSNWGYISYYPESTGQVTVTGSGSQWNNTERLYVGYDAEGTLTVEDGGLVSNVAGYLGYNPNLTSVAMVTGSGSQWNSSESLFLGGTESADGGTGILTLEDSAQVNVGNALYTGIGGAVNVSAISGSNGNLWVRNGSSITNAGVGVVGYSSGAFGNAIVTGTGSQWTNSNGMYVGYAGNGSLDIEAGGVVSSESGTIGYQSDSFGYVTVTGRGSQWNIAGDLHVGDSGQGRLNVELEGVVNNAVGYIGANSPMYSSNYVTVSGIGSQWNNTGGLFLGGTETTGGWMGALYIEEGGQVNVGDDWFTEFPALSVSDTGSNGNLLVRNQSEIYNSRKGFIGHSPGSTGVATVTGEGSRWENADLLYVGEYGSGTLNIEAGGDVFGTSGYIGAYPGSTGVVTVTGSYSYWRNDFGISVGGTSGSAGGTGTLNVLDDSEVSVVLTLKIWESGTVNFNGGTIRAGTLDPVAGTFNWTAGELNVDNYVGNLVQDVGTLDVGSVSRMTAITGDYMLNSEGTLKVFLANSGVAGTDFELLEVAGDAVLGGTLEVGLSSLFTPVAGDKFEILTAASVSGTFDTINLPALPDDLLWFVNYGATSVELVSTYAADFNEDGLVDAADMVAWKGGFGSGLANHGDGDADANAVASGIDFLSWQRQFASPAAPLAVTVFVPEPTSLGLACFALLGMGLCRRWRAEEFAGEK